MNTLIEKARQEPKCEQLIKEYNEAIEKKEEKKIKMIEIVIKNKLKNIIY